MIGPTPASANIAPSAASACGSTAAQLTASIKPPRFGDRRGERRAQHQHADDRARRRSTTPSEMSVICFWSTSGVPLTRRSLEGERAEQRDGGNGERRE